MESRAEFHQIYTAASHLNVQREAAELIRSGFLRLQGEGGLSEGSFNVEINDDAAAHRYTVILSGTPALVNIFAGFFRGVRNEGRHVWHQKKKIAMALTVNARYANSTGAVVNVPEFYAAEATVLPTRIGEISGHAATLGSSTNLVAHNTGEHRASRKNIRSIPYTLSEATAFGVFQAELEARRSLRAAADAAQAVYTGQNPDVLRARLLERLVLTEMKNSVIGMRLANQRVVNADLKEFGMTAYMTFAEQMFGYNIRTAANLARFQRDNLPNANRVVDRLLAIAIQTKPKKGGARRTVKKRRTH